MSTATFKTASLLRTSLVVSLAAAAVGCSNPQPGPDKTAAGALLGAGWGAGAGAVIGHQVSYAGEGAAIGAGFGAVAGALSGGGYDLAEGTQLDHERQLAALKVQNITNQREMERLQARGLFTPPTLAGLEAALDGCLDLSPAVITADLWDAERIATCVTCGPARVARLGRINLTGRAEARVACSACDGQ